MNTKKIVFIGLFSAIICVLSPISIPTGLVPVTLSSFAIMLTGLILPKGMAVLSVIIYIFSGAIGLPVFSGFKGGFAVLFGPTGGYILAYPVMVFIISLFADKGTYKRMFGIIISLAICYLLGSVQLALINRISFVKALAAGVAPFIPFDIIKLVLALFVSKPLQKACASFYKMR